MLRAFSFSYKRAESCPQKTIITKNAYLCTIIIKKHISMIEYITQEGYDKLMNELHHLLSVERPKIADAISEARDKGDLSENFEYHAAKREQGKLEGRIDRLKMMLSNARVMEMSRLNTDTVQLLSTVELTDLSHDRTMTYTIVNQIESDFSSGKISIKTPIAQGLLKKKVGDIAEIKVPAGILRLRIDKISIQS